MNPILLDFMDDYGDGETARFVYDFLYGKPSYEFDDPERLESHWSMEWKEEKDVYGASTRVHRGDDNAYQVAMPLGGGDWVYFIHAPEVNRVKIGYSNNPAQRLATLQTSSPVQLRLIKLIPGDRDDEAMFHRRFDDRRIDGEWFEDSVLEDLR